MKKIMLSIFILVIGIVVIIEGYYYGNLFYQKAKAKKPIEEAIQATHMPQKEIYVIQNNQYGSDNAGDWVDKVITTKKDYENWKKTVLQRNRYFNNKKLINKNEVNKVENCEITYDFTYNPKSKSIKIDYVLAGNSAGSKEIQEYFNYAKRGKDNYE
ncbi:hypothetical protein [Listeria sp. PSOL-1]|uniref:hypothetical protein n=1 Tax=Listeria sp. PSOL-1 TaxID=1844999 RepID=UPI0013D32C36|nr:hypothetical protein [Listeria sp. PSOL-1]